jgi:hypothetical protein
VQAAQALAERSLARADEAANRPAAPGALPQQNEAAVTDLSNRLGALETQLRDGVQALERRLAEQDQRLTGLVQPVERRLAEQEQRLAGLVQPLERRLAEQEQRLAGVTQPLDRRLAEQEQRLAGLTRQVAEGGSDATRAGTRVVLADRLGDALREGAPYAEVLAGLRRYTPDPGKLAPLDAFAERGAPTAAALAQSFKPIAERLRRDARQGQEDWTDRLLRMTEKIVTVRTPNDSDGTSVSALVTRVEEALDRGDVAGAAAAWDALPEQARQASAGWGEQVKQRAAAGSAARAAAADAVAALNQAAR